MSRCFPYPPPYFGEAQIESIKKEKERLEVEAKKERKREKKEKKKERKEKKEKRSGKDHELSKELKKSIKRKYEELGLVESTDKRDSPEQHRSKKSKDEQLETSGLSEEHGLPSIKLGSPQRSHDSSKRSNLGRTPSPSVSLTNSGSTLRIKLQPKSRDFVPQPQTSKPKGSISTPQLVKSGELTRNREPVPVVQASKPRTTSAPQKPRADSVQQTLNPRAPVVHTQKLKDPVLESPVPKPRDVVPHALKAVPKTTSVQKQLSSLKSETGLAQSSLVSRSSASKESVIKANIEPCAQSQVPKERAVIQKPVHAVRPKERDVAVDGGSLPHVLKQDERPMVSGMPPVVPDEPCFSGRVIDAGQKRESKHHHRHSSKKSKRKEAEKLFEDLISNWKPADVDQFQHGMEDLDWLMYGAKKRRVESEEGEDDDWLSKSSKCKVGGGLLDHTNGMSGSYQTKAVYLPQLDMYQLPYVVPF